jgi:hypothetical protein
MEYVQGVFKRYTLSTPRMSKFLHKSFHYIELVRSLNRIAAASIRQLDPRDRVRQGDRHAWPHTPERLRS